MTVKAGTVREKFWVELELDLTRNPTPGAIEIEVDGAARDLAKVMSDWAHKQINPENS